MEATTLLQRDHDAVRRLFQAFENADGNPSAQGELFAQIAEELEVHARIEEEVFYPAVRDAAPPADEDAAMDLIDESREEHGEVRDLVEEIDALDPIDEEFPKQVKKLHKAVERHASEEEKEMFPFARQHLDPVQLADLGARMEARKKELSPRDPHARVESGRM